jgi:hypothetical protein
MVDFTTIQVNPIPLPIIELQKANSNLQGDNKFLRNILIGLAVGGVILIGYNMYKKITEDARKLEAKLSRDKENGRV